VVKQVQEKVTPSKTPLIIYLISESVFEDFPLADRVWGQLEISVPVFEEKAMVQQRPPLHLRIVKRELSVEMYSFLSLSRRPAFSQASDAVGAKEPEMAGAKQILTTLR